MGGRLFLRLMALLTGLCGAAILMVDLTASRVAESSYVETVAERLEREGRALVAAERQQTSLGRPALQELAAALEARLTLIAPDGAVLADSQADPARMENHLSRPEVAAALAGHRGRAIRRSGTTGLSYLYVAIPADQRILRLAVPLADVEARQRAIRSRMLGSVALAFLPLLLVAAWLARRASARLARVIEFTGQLAEGNFAARLGECGNPEQRMLIRHLNQTAERLQRVVQDLEREHAELAKLERVRRDFVVNVSHELRTPVASIQGYAETLLDGALSDERHNRRFLEIIRHNAERLGRLTNDLLALSRLEMKACHFQFAACRLQTLLTDALDAIRPLAQKRQVSLRQQPLASDLEVFCDPQAFHQILGNLLDNAVKFSPAGGEVTVSAQPFGQPGWVEICVRDQGPGIPPDDLSRVFERFYRVDKARSRELGGTGLGLAIVKHLVLAHGGSARVESEPGKGAAFYVTLPQTETAGTDGESLHREFAPS